MLVCGPERTSLVRIPPVDGFLEVEVVVVCRVSAFVICLKLVFMSHQEARWGDSEARCILLMQQTCAVLLINRGILIHMFSEVRPARAEAVSKINACIRVCVSYV